MTNNLLLDIFQWQKLFGTLLGLSAISLSIFLLRSASERILQHWKRKRLLLLKIRSILILLIYLIGAAAIIRGVWGLSREGFLVFGATTMVALGFAFKDLIASIIAGLVLIFDGPFQVGDRVTFQGIYGDIKTIGLRATRLVTLDDTLVTIPNHLFLNEAAFSGNAGSLEMLVAVDFYVALEADLALARRLVEEAIATAPYVDRQRPVIVLAKETNLGSLPVYQLKAKTYLQDFLKEKPFETELTIKVQEFFQGHKIPRPLAPFPLPAAVTGHS
jgi:small-conductance mechanosensitive channel